MPPADMSGALPQTPAAVREQTIARPPVTLLTGFGLGSLGTGLYSTVPSFLLLYFMTETLRVRPALAGIAVFTPKIWSLLTDPLIGVVSDGTRSRLGRRRPYILAGALLVPLLFALLFNVPASLSELDNFLFVLLVYGIGITAYSVFSVPYLALPSEMSRDRHVRTEIMSFRMGFVLIGVMLGMSAAPALVDHFGGGRPGYAHMADLLGVICAAAMLVTYFVTAALPERTEATPALQLAASLRAAWLDRGFRNLLGIYWLQILGASVFSGVAPYFVANILRQSLSILGLLFLTLLSLSVLAMPVWTALSRRLEKRTALAVAALVYAASSIALLLVRGPGSLGIAFIAMGFLGFGFGGVQLLPYSMMTDAIHANRAATGSWKEGAFTGVWTSLEKSALALGPLLTGIVLSLAGFIPHAATAARQPHAALTAIALLFSLCPAGLLLVSAALLRRAPLYPDARGTR
jgi:Na+/melibiose symporter-like transporter